MEMVEIEMEQTGRCVVKVTDEQNNPLVGAKVASSLYFTWSAENFRVRHFSRALIQKTN